MLVKVHEARNNSIGWERDIAGRFLKLSSRPFVSKSPVRSGFQDAF